MRKKSNSPGGVKAANIVFAVAAILAVWGCFTFRLVRIHGDSMYPYFHDGQRVLIDTRFDAGSLRKDDVIVFETESGYAVKRILATEGDRVVLASGEVKINSMRVFPYTCDENADAEYNLGTGQFFVIGDNYLVSYDSRDYGPIELDDIVGKVVIKF